MSIDSGQPLIFDAGFPLPNVDQSSQQFRDNFSIIKTATERLQTMHSDNSSVVAVTASMNGAEVILNATYKDGGLVLPTGSPGTALTGMIRYSSTVSSIQFYNGGWNTVIAKDPSGLVTLPLLTVTTNLTLGFSPTNPTDAVPKSYVDSYVLTLTNADATEQSARIAADANLQAQIDNTFVNQQALDDVMNAVVRAEDTANTAATNANAALLIANEAEADLDAALDAANTALAASNAVANALAQEILDREQGDSDLANAIANTNSNFAYYVSNAYINDHGGVSNVFTVANNVIGLAGLLANVGGTDANAVQKTGDTMSGALTMNANLDITNSNILFIGGSDTELVYQTSGSYGSTNFLVKSNLRTTAIESTGHIYLNPTGSSNLYVGDASSQRLTLDQSGNLTVSGDMVAFSDVSLKYNIQTIENALDKVDAMRGVVFNRADLPGNPEQVGVIAQEMQEVVPQVVHEQPNGLLGVAYGNLTAVLIEAVKELRAELNEIKSRLS